MLSDSLLLVPVSSTKGHPMKKIVIRKAGPVRLTSSAQTMYGCGCDA